MFYICKKHLYVIAVCAVIISFLSFRSDNESDNFHWIEVCFKSCFDEGTGISKLKKWELSVTNKGFFRLRKFYPNGKQEYFSFNLSRLADLNYIGSVESGEIVLKTKSDDIIVQTYNDPKGNIDSMANCLKIQAFDVEPEKLDSLLVRLNTKSMR